MKGLLLLFIKIYWKIIPSKLKRTCLFRESCSHYVYRETNENGFYKGIESFWIRFKQCRKGHKLYTGKDGFEMELVDGSILKEQEISELILKPIYEKVNQFNSLK